LTSFLLRKKRRKCQLKRRRKQRQRLQKQLTTLGTALSAPSR
jgi:hypothetical protein